MKRPFVNRLFTFGCFSTPPIAGSAVSFLWHAGALWGAFEIATRRRRLSADRLMWRLTLLLYLYVAATALSFLLNGPVLDGAEKLLPLITLMLFPFCYSVWAICEKKAMMEAVVLGSAVASYGALVLALIQYWIVGDRPEGAAGNALVFSLVTCMAGSVCLTATLILENRWRLALVGGYLASVLAVLYSESRSLWGVMVVFLLVTAVVFHRQLRTMLTGHYLKVLAIAIVIGALSFGVLTERIEQLLTNWEQLTEDGRYNSSIGLRFAMWEIGAQRVLLNPILGNGVQNTETIIREGLSEYGIERGFTHFHNGFLTLLVESGIVGGGAIIAIFVLALWTAAQTLRSSEDPSVRFGAMLLLIFVVTYGVGGSVNIVLGHDIIDTMFMVFLIVGTFLACGKPVPDQAVAEQEPDDGTGFNAPSAQAE